MRTATTGIVHGIYFGLLVEWRTDDLTVQTAFWEMGRGGITLPRTRSGQRADSEYTEPRILDSPTLAELLGT